MTSINTNVAAISALRNLQNVNSALETTNERIASGKAVNKASDNPSLWAVATKLESHNSSDKALRDSLATGKALMGTVSAMMTAVVDDLEELQSLVTSARQTGADRAAIQKEVDAVVLRLESLAATQPMDGVTLFTDDPTGNNDLTYVTSLNHGATVTAGTITVATDDFVLVDSGGNNNGILDGTAGNLITGLDGTTVSAITDATVGNLDAWIAAIDTAIAAATDGAQTAGSAVTAMESAENYLNTIIDARTAAVGELVDANMEEESTKLRALQTQQQLAVEALSIANTQSASILGLFR
ncbi:flagellin N-terminal helical domain-containing protein [Acuticoccus yangtzensis]|uniref:flagellin N-terminal helical domain-containing protein n=1 Tax=Acuticoccus yangtzensis TaxID=1443441 RepID=UPI0009496502|nr:flagellin [Acuticoccus yangtzensis]ORE95794.1 flagellin C protein [Stappia sp. 22II-S9-Z10]